MEIVIVSWIGSVIISTIVCNIIGIHYLDKLECEWTKVFKEMSEFTLQEIKKLRH